MDVRFPGFIDTNFLNTIQDMLDQFAYEAHDTKAPPQQQQQQQQLQLQQEANNPSQVYVNDTKAMARTPADIKDLPKAYEYIVDMPGVSPSEVKVQLQDSNVLVVSGERRKDEEGGVKYMKMERRVGKFMRRFVLPENANVEKISAVCKDGVLTVTVDKVLPPEPKKPKVIEVKGA